MKRFEIDLPDNLADEIDAAVRDGWFSTPADLVRVALQDYVRTHKFELLERQQREDIAWALKQRKPRSAA
jgi:Arc/MetJ-type ribon-helix-helix transcriptional regulator